MNKNLKIIIPLAITLGITGSVFIYNKFNTPSDVQPIESFVKSDDNTDVDNTPDAYASSSENKQTDDNAKLDESKNSGTKNTDTTQKTDSSNNNVHNSKNNSEEMPSDSTNDETSKDATSNEKDNASSASFNSKNNHYPGNLPPIPNNYDMEFLDDVETEILNLCNIERDKAGLQPLSLDSTLRQASKYKANEMLQYGYFDHNSPYTGSPFDLIKSFGINYSAAGENVQTSKGMSKSSVTAEFIVTNWMNSPGHKANILNTRFNKMGIGVAFSSNGDIAYESQLFSN